MYNFVNRLKNVCLQCGKSRWHFPGKLIPIFWAAKYSLSECWLRFSFVLVGLKNLLPSKRYKKKNNTTYKYFTWISDGIIHWRIHDIYQWVFQQLHKLHVKHTICHHFGRVYKKTSQYFFCSTIFHYLILQLCFVFQQMVNVPSRQWSFFLL